MARQDLRYETGAETRISWKDRIQSAIRPMGKGAVAFLALVGSTAPAIFDGSASAAATHNKVKAEKKTVAAPAFSIANPNFCSSPAFGIMVAQALNIDPTDIGCESDNSPKIHEFSSSWASQYNEYAPSENTVIETMRPDFLNGVSLMKIVQKESHEAKYRDNVANVGNIDGHPAYWDSDNAEFRGVVVAIKPGVDLGVTVTTVDNNPDFNYRTAATRLATALVGELLQ